MSSIKVLIITASDSASSGKSQDLSGPEIQRILQHHGYQDISTIVLPDDGAQIRQTVQDHSGRGAIDWIITTGGTGFGVKDRTPEAISPLIERHASGIVHLLLSASMKHTPFAALSRPVAGTIKNTLVVTLPGSVKAVRENMEALLSDGVVAHAIDLIKGGSGKQVHAALGTSHTAGPASSTPDHHHHHHHHDGHQAPKPRTLLSYDPSAPVPGRHRISPYPQISLEAALQLILTEIQPLGSLELPVTPTLAGHVLAEDVYAPQNVPSSRTTNVDGYALRSSDLPGIYNVLTWKTSALAEDVPQGSVFRVNTGGPLPAGTNAVIMVEDTELVSTVKDANDKDLEESQVKTLVQVSAGENVRLPGSDVRTGDLVLQRNDIITSLGGEIGTLAFVGRKEVKVRRKPIVALLSTGNEILDLQSPNSLPSDGWGGIYDTNRPSLQATLEGMGYKVVDIGIVPDDVDSHVQAIAKGLQEADLLLTTGGTSMGSSDLVKPVIERRFAGTIHFGRVSMKPGKPTTFASIPIPDKQGERKYLFALPGNPASALVTFHIFVVPALRQLGGWPVERCQLPCVKAQIQNTMHLDPRVHFHRVVVKATPDGLKAYSTGGQRSSRVASLSGANALVRLPILQEGGPSQLQAGEWVDTVIIGEIQV
ncbi:MoaB/Mog domain-containing protein [Boletus reticuloceps]|uniref:MoaB/Mog domain-containing protein n=1 Tax=Boletus reticuloceps TaxID=495285 RepID=A0A8I2YL69_9AGAM|nr:MoaB/Mog domain-containing protein [Boletus reticuloceps]